MPKRLSDRERLAQHMDDQRVELGLTWRQVAERAGMTTEGLRGVRQGPSEIRALTRRSVEDALQWSRGSIQRILDGHEPIPSDLRVTDERTGLRAEVEQLAGQVPDASLGRARDWLWRLVHEPEHAPQNGDRTVGQ